MNGFEKTRIVVASSCFGLGPVGKLAAIIKCSGNEFAWFAVGEKFDSSVFEKNVFIDTCWSMDRDTVLEFIKKYDIKMALVVLKNKMARLLTDLGVKVVYVDSLPFMWTLKDAEEGKIPYNVAYYCAQKTLPLSETSEHLFRKVENLIWINPIVNRCINIGQKEDYVLINLGGMHSPYGTNIDYLELILIPLIKTLKKLNREIIVTCGKTAQNDVRLVVDSNVTVTTFDQDTFLKKAFSASLLFTSPGLTTIVELLQGSTPVVLLPPQNLSQFYNTKYARTVLSQYKCIDWMTKKLSLEFFTQLPDLDEGEIVRMIYRSIQEENTLDNQLKYQKYITTILNSDYIINFVDRLNLLDGAIEIANILSIVKNNIKIEGEC